MNFPQLKQKLVSALFFLQLPQLISLPSPLFCTARSPNRLFCRKPVGNWSKRSGTPTCAWHSGQRNFPSRWVVRACLFKHSQQNVWRQAIVLGSVKVSKQIEHVTCSLRFFKRDSIVYSVSAPHRLRNNWRECYDCFVLILAANQRDIRLTLWPRTSSLCFRSQYPILRCGSKEKKSYLWSLVTPGEYANTKNFDQKKKRKEKYSHLYFFQPKFVTSGHVTWLLLDTF